MEKQKICIIGGGLTGLITAAVLSRLNLKVDLVTNNIHKSIKSERTTAISHYNYSYLKKFSFFKSLKKLFWPCGEMKLYSREKNEILSEIFNFKTKKKKQNKILYMMNNSEVIAKLCNRLKKEKLIKFKFKKKVSEITSNGVPKNLKLKKINNSKYNLIIFCVGGNSDLSKKMLRQDTFSNSYNEVALTTILKHNSLKNNAARQIFLDNQIFALLPLSNSKTSIVWTVKKKYFLGLSNKKNSFTKKKIHSLASIFLSKIKFSNKIEFGALNFLIRKKYFDDRMLLFGDALHTVHPLVGQGFNMSLRDLIILEKILKEKLDLGIDVGATDTLLEFSKAAKSRNFAYFLGINFLKDYFSVKNNFFSKFRNLTVSNVNKNKFIKNIFFNLANEGFKF